MDEAVLFKRIEELERENRVLKHKLETSERNRFELEETLATHTNAMRVRNLELEESRDKLKDSETHYREQALHDRLTELPNRFYFNQIVDEALVRAETTKTNTALLFMDLNQFKSVNDNYGHKVGDTVLAQMAKRLLSCIREGDVAARLGGDEFAILLPAVRSAEDAEKVALRVIDALKKPFDVGDQTSKIGVSVGISVFPDDACDGDKLLQYADMAMYSIKKRGENSYAFFSSVGQAKD